jgi:chemotaxis protein methyltransferase CheR
MTDEECVAFLQWALPRLGLRWAGYRKVRRQVCKRISRRIGELALPDLPAYRAYLERHPGEWAVLDRLCPVTISRFYRDRDVFDYLCDVLLPELARAAAARGEETLRALSLGCASGEEPYTLMLVWQLAAVRPAGVALQVLATDVDETVLARARRGCYPAGSLKCLPARWLEQAFERRGDEWCLRPAYREGVAFLRQDVREALPSGPFDLVLCRNLAFTYFDERAQRRCLAQLLASLRHGGGALVIGRRERLPASVPALTPYPTVPGVYRKT